jgi:glycosyltransferase involved in cell wall biosynthesis
VTGVVTFPLKILHVIPSADPATGGPIEAVIQLDRVWAQQGLARSEAVTLDEASAPYLNATNFKVHPLGGEGRLAKLPLFKHYRYSEKLVPWLKKHARDYDAVIVHGLWNYSTLGAARVLPAASVPYFVFSHGMLDPWFRKVNPLKHAAKQIFWLFGEGRLLQSADAVLFTCEEERTLAHGEFWGRGEYRGEVVGLGAQSPPRRDPAQTAAFRAATPQLKDRPYLLFFSRIHPKKGCDILIEAFANVFEAHPDVDLLMVGPDQVGWRAELEATAARLGVNGRIHWPGPLYSDAKWGALYGADAFVLSSHQENFGIAVAESLGCGVPVLITDKINIWREIEAAGAGVIATDTVESFTKALRSWFELGRGERDEMRRKASTLFSAEFDIEVTAPALLRSIGDRVGTSKSSVPGAASGQSR